MEPFEEITTLIDQLNEVVVPSGIISIYAYPKKFELHMSESDFRGLNLPYSVSAEKFSDSQTKEIFAMVNGVKLFCLTKTEKIYEPWEEWV